MVRAASRRCPRKCPIHMSAYPRSRPAEVPASPSPAPLPRLPPRQPLRCRRCRTSRRHHICRPRRRAAPPARRHSPATGHRGGEPGGHRPHHSHDPDDGQPPHGPGDGNAHPPADGPPQEPGDEPPPPGVGDPVPVEADAGWPEFTLDNPLDHLSEELLRLSEQHLTRSGETVLGPFKPDGGGLSYIDFAELRGASYFDIGDAWNAATPVERLAANQHVLDIAIANGDTVTLSVPFDMIRPNTFTAAEIRYLELHGYRQIKHHMGSARRGEWIMKTLLEYFIKYFEVLYLDPRYHITDSSTSGVASNNASLKITGPILSWNLSNDRGQFLLAVAPTARATSDNWFSVSLIKQYLNGQDEVEYSSAADEIAWIRANGERVEELFSNVAEIGTISETLRSLRRSNANTYWKQWRGQQGLS